MPNNELRDSMQKEALARLIEKKRLIVEWGTGVGKSRTAIASAQALSYAGKTKILLLVVETAHKSNWQREFIDAIGEKAGMALFESITVECYASLKKYENTSWDLVIADEAHHLRSDKRIAGFATLTAEYILCLSATLSDRNDADALLKTMIDTFGPFERMRFNMQDAIDSEILAPPRIIVHVLTLEDVEGEFEINVSWGWPNARREISTTADGLKRIRDDAKYHPNVSATVTCSAREGYDILQSEQERIQAEYKAINEKIEDITVPYEEKVKALKKREYIKTAIKRAGLSKKEFIGECKTNVARGIVSSLKEKRFICFCSSVKQGKQLNAKRIVSFEKKSAQNDAIISDFNNGTQNALFAVGMLQEGANLAGIEAGIIVQLDRKARSFIQKLGRTMRSSDPEEHLILINHSADAKYYKEAVSELDTSYITYVDAVTGRPLILMDEKNEKQTLK